MKSPHAKRYSRGLTLIELLITITVMAVLAALVIPAVRMLTRDRKIRETARVVGAVFASARDRGIIDGWSGVLIQRNQPNFPNGSIKLYEMRAIPPYQGELIGDQATITMTTAPPDPLTPGFGTATLDNIPAVQVQPNDFIQFGLTGAAYRITNDVTTTTVNFQIDPSQPVPGAAEPRDFKIIRQPRKMESSEVELPNRQYIDLTLSGHGSSLAQFDSGTGDIIVWFDGNGSVDSILYEGGGGPVFEPASGSVYLLIATLDTADSSAPNNLQDMDNLWVVVSRDNGNVSVGSNAESDPTDSAAIQLQDARLLARNRRSAKE